MAASPEVFLEEHVGISSINTAITNQRDVLSHLGTVLRNTELSFEEQVEQIGKAEEHLHRSVFETYENAVSLMLKKVFGLRDSYTESVLTLNPPLKTAPNLVSIQARITDIEYLRVEARKAKGKNSWNDDALKGIQHSVKAVMNLKELAAELEDFIVKADSIRGHSSSRKLSIAQIVIGLAGIIIGVVFTMILT